MYIFSPTVRVCFLYVFPLKVTVICLEKGYMVCVCVFILVWDLKQSVWRNARLLLWHPSHFLFTCLCLSICLSSLSPSAPHHSHSLMSVISSPYLLPFSYYSLFLSLLRPSPTLTSFISLSNFSASVSPANPFCSLPSNSVEVCDCRSKSRWMAGRRKDYGPWLNLMDRFMSLACPLNHRGHQRLPLTSRTRCVLNEPADDA